ncbi:MAG: hypothetical protein HY392_02420, partial [Candidatus Diapherotrites archaeon]|nr:hypothetical protein [Candidatus Diapherotrites archaeon]
MAENVFQLIFYMIFYSVSLLVVVYGLFFLYVWFEKIQVKKFNEKYPATAPELERSEEVKFFSEKLKVGFPYPGSEGGPRFWFYRTGKITVTNKKIVLWGLKQPPTEIVPQIMKSYYLFFKQPGKNLDTHSKVFTQLGKVGLTQTSRIEEVEEDSMEKYFIELVTTNYSFFDKHFDPWLKVYHIAGEKEELEELYSI